MVRQSVTTSQSSYHKSSNKVPSVAPVPVHEALAGEPLRHLGVDLPRVQFNRHFEFITGFRDQLRDKFRDNLSTREQEF